ncbi:glycosyltransferase family 2 protein [Algoriphagus marinus]|uniref:glycosyltransferase family 2 protein n=1 Tax=Algoriphagus marinus TaxID=1925762 RepID=UPI00094BB4B5|nr:glycosyltransferase family 2 protein [Algoriphagus marinus]
MTLVSFIIPHYNSVQYINETISSIESQTYKNFEIIVVDDNSSEEVFKELKNIINGREKISLYSLPKQFVKGANSCRNFGLLHSKGDFVNFIDSDDIILPTKIEAQLKVFTNNPDLGMVVCKTQYFADSTSNKLELLQEQDFSISDDFLEAYISKKSIWCTNSALIRKSKLGTISFHPGFLDAHEWLFYIELMIAGINVGFVNDVLVLKRKHSGSIGNSSLSKKLPSLIESRLLVIDFINSSPLDSSIYIKFLIDDINSFLKSSAKRNMYSLYFSTISKFNLSVVGKIRCFINYTVHSTTKKGDSLISIPNN